MNALRRVLGLRDATALVVGCIVGAGVFRVAAPGAPALPPPGPILLVWIAGGLISFCGALCYAELGAAYPKAGGDYVYLTRAYGRLTGFLFGWTKVFIERTGTIAILAFVFAEYLGHLTGLSATAVRVLATLAVMGLTAANIAGVQHGSRVQIAMTTLKVAALAAIIAVGGWWCWQGGVVPTTAADVAVSWSGFGLALVFVLWTYGGWAESAYLAEEVRDPARTVPWSILWGLALTTTLYLLVNAVYLAVIPAAQMPQYPLVASEVMRRAVGPWGGRITAGIVMASAFGALNGYILTSGRILMAMGQDHPVLARLGAVHPRFATPAAALLFNAAAAVLLIWTGTLDTIVTYSTVVISVFYGMTAVAVPILRRRDPATPRPYRTWGSPAVPLLFAAAMAWLVADVTLRRPAEVLAGFALLALALPLYRR